MEQLLDLLLIDSNIKWHFVGQKTPKDIGAGIAEPRNKLFNAMCHFPSIFQAAIFTVSRCVKINLQRNYRN